MKTILSREEISREMNSSRIADKGQQRANMWLPGQRKEDVQALGISLKWGAVSCPNLDSVGFSLKCLRPAPTDSDLLSFFL